METLGLIAGVGYLPVEVARSAHELGYKVVAVAVVPDTDAELPNAVDEFYNIHVGKVGKILKTLKKSGCTKVTMIGKVTKEILYKAGHFIPDLTTIKVLATLPDRKDDTLMNAVVKLLQDEGMEVMDQTILIQSLLPKAGVLTKRSPTEHEKADMEFGFKMAKAIGELDLGQTVVVKNRAVMAAECIEGTDACILRGGFLGKGGVIVAKTAKPQQDNRFDMPSVGMKTMESLKAAGATGLVIEAGRTLLVERKKVLDFANANNMTIVAIKK